MTTPPTTTRPRFKPTRLAAASLACLLALAPALSAQAANVIWIGGTGDWANSPSWIGGVPPAATANVYIDNGNALNSAVTLSTSAYIGELFIDGGDRLNVSGGVLGMNGNLIRNNGTLTLAATSSAAARMSIGSAVTLTGSGSTVLASDTNSGNRAAINGGTLTIASGHTVRGAGDFGSGSFGSLNVVNQGTVIAEGGTLNTYQAGAQKFDNTAGLVQIASGSALLINGNFTGGTVQSLATGSGTALLGGSTFTDVALRGALAVQNTLSLSNSTIHDSLRVAGAVLNANGTLTNNGTLTFAGTSVSFGRLSIGSAATLAGSGTTVLTSDTNSGNRAAINGGTLTIASGHTVRGAGDFGSGSYGSLNVINQGTVIAEGGTLNTYQVGAQKFDNTAGLVQIADGARLVANGSFLGGTIQGLGLSALSGSTFTNVTLTGSLSVAAGTAASVSGTLTNNGSLSLSASNASYSRLLLSEDTTLGGTGTTRLSSDAASGYRSVISGSRTLTVGSGQTVRGAGDLGSASFGSLNAINQGTLIAEGGVLNLYQTGTASFNNTAGLVQIADGASLVQSGRFTGGSIQSLGNASISGSTYSGVALSGQFTVQPGATLGLSDATHSGSLTVAGAQLNTQGTISTTGTLTLRGTSSAWGRMNLASGTTTTLAGSGTTVLDSNASSGYRGVIGGSGTLTIASGHTVRGAGDLGSTSFGAINVINQGTVIAEGGTLNTYQTGSQTFNNTAGLVQIANGAKLVANGSFTGGTIQGLGLQSTLSGSRFNNVTLAGTLAVAAGTSATVAGTLTNNGNLSLAASNNSYSRLMLAADTTLAGTGITTLSSDAASGYRAVVSGTGTLTLASGQTVRGAGDLGSTSFGSLTVINHGTVLADGGVLSAYSGSIAFDNRAGMLAATSDGVLNFSSALQLADASLLRIGITGSTGHAQVGLLKLSGNAAFDGQVLLDLSGYSGAQVGDSFSFASYTGSSSGVFDAVSAIGYTFTTSYANHQVTATITGVTAVPEPESWAMLLAGLFAVGSVVRRRRPLG